MSLSSGDADGEFILVKSRSRRACKKAFNETVVQIEQTCESNITTSSSPDEQSIYQEKIVRKVKAAVNQLRETEYYKSFYKVLIQSLKELDRNRTKFLIPTKIVCFGLGTFSDCMIARYQLGLLILLQQDLKISVELFDPIFSFHEKNILLKEFGFTVLSENEEGKRTVENLTLFYLPHCSHQLVNNLLYSNWSAEKLQNCIIISNSFVNINETLPSRVLSETLTFISRVQIACMEFRLVNCFQYSDIFNDTAIHIFPNYKLNLIEKEYWSDRTIPLYSNLDFVPIKKPFLNEIKETDES